jgi:hypothetical protein
VAFLLFAVGVQFGATVIGGVTACALVAGIGVFEMVRVMRGVFDLHMSAGGMIVVTDGGTRCWSLDPAGEVPDQGRLVDRSNPTIEAALGRQ